MKGNFSNAVLVANKKAGERVVKFVKVKDVGYCVK